MSRRGDCSRHERQARSSLDACTTRKTRHYVNMRNDAMLPQCLSKVRGSVAMEHVEVPADQQRDDEGLQRQPIVLPFTAATVRRLGRQDAAELMTDWRASELRSIGGWVQCRGLSADQLEDVYQETVVELLGRDHKDEEHLRYALRSGIRMRAMNMRRDGRGREGILAAREPELRLLADARQALEQPEQIVLAEQDRLIAWEFMTELSDAEKRIYELVAEGMGAGRIARTRGIQVNDARRLMGVCERKRQTFQRLYEAGRLCGYRASTIQALMNGEPSTQALAERAFAHLDSCPRCRAEHKTTAKKLRRGFRDQVAALLPGPILATHLGWSEKFGIRARVVHHRLATGDLPFVGPGVHERTATIFAGGGLASKLAAGTATLALLAGGASVATHALDHHSIGPHKKTSPLASTTAHQTSPASRHENLVSAHAARASHQASHRRGAFALMPGRVVPLRRADHAVSSAPQREPGGLAYLGIPANQ